MLTAGCPLCGFEGRFLVIDRRVVARCHKCETRFLVECASCASDVDVEALTGVDEPPCGTCGEPLELAAGALLDRVEERGAHDEPRWAPYTLEEPREQLPYRGGATRRALHLRAPTARRERLLLAGALAAPAILPMLGGYVWAGVAWALATGTFVAAARPYVSLDVDLERVVVRRGGLMPTELSLEASEITRVWWAGRGAVCALWARTADGASHRLFEPLDPPQARALERKVRLLIG